MTRKQILRRYSYMLKDVNAMSPIVLFGIECGDGWLKIVGELLQKISAADKAQRVRLAQVKEKYGILRVYVDYATDKVYNIIGKYEYLSGRTCEICGRPGKMRDIGGWYTVRCEKCFAKGDQA